MRFINVYSYLLTYSTSSSISSQLVTGNRLRADKLCKGRLSLAIPLWLGALSTGDITTGTKEEMASSAYHQAVLPRLL